MTSCRFPGGRCSRWWGGALFILAVGGVLLWRRDRWRYPIAAMAGIQGALYLLVLAVNSVVIIARGIAQAPGEVPVWGTLGLVTAASMALLLANARGELRP